MAQQQTTSVRIDGLRELGERMRSLSADMAGRVARQATADAIGRDAAQGCPRPETAA